MKYFIPILLLSFLSACSDAPSALETGEFLETEIRDGQLTVKNNSILPIYYFAVEAELAARINWAPFSDEENRILPFETVKISLEEISVTEEGQSISFYYWKEEDPQTEDIKGLLIKRE